MSVYSIWESEFPSNQREEGIEVTRAIWRDMPASTATSRTRSLRTSTSPAI
jgi:hypothetical protein